MPIYNKLVRDKIPNIIKKDGKKPKIQTISLENIQTYRFNKVKEELQELEDALHYPQINEPEDTLREVADVLEIAWYCIYNRKVTKKDIEKVYSILLEKRKTNGAFDKNILLVEVLDND